MTDIEEVQHLAGLREQERIEFMAKQQKHAAVADAARLATAEDEKKKNHELALRLKSFNGFPLPSSGHLISVIEAYSHPPLRIPNDGNKYISLIIQHYGAETAEFQGHIPLLAVRFHASRYELRDLSGTEHAKSEDSICKKTNSKLAAMDQEYMKKVFTNIRMWRSSCN